MYFNIVSLLPQLLGGQTRIESAPNFGQRDLAAVNSNSYQSTESRDLVIETGLGSRDVLADDDVELSVNAHLLTTSWRVRFSEIGQSNFTSLYRGCWTCPALTIKCHENIARDNVGARSSGFGKDMKYAQDPVAKVYFHNEKTVDAGVSSRVWDKRVCRYRMAIYHWRNDSGDRSLVSIIFM
jgi:hypothetical protein